VVLVGSNGQLAHDLVQAWAEVHPGDELVGLTHAQVEVADLDSVRTALRPLRPQVVVNTAAYHKVDVVEGDPSRAFAVNATGPMNLALVCRELDAVLIHLSSDYVFSGSLKRPHREQDPVDPVNVYGVSKAAGEMLVRYLWPRHHVVRSSGLYGVAGSSGKGGNFVELMLRLAGEGKPIRVVDDQVLTPTSTRALARQLVTLVDSGRFGLYHATCQGECSWYRFTQEILRQSGVAASLQPQTTEESGAAAKRPRYSVLDNHNLRQLGLDRMPAWQDALAAYLAERKAAAAA
jgi:dTDP-4-dehydrorhamnose reductase